MREPDSGSLLERTRDRLRQTWRDVVGAARVKLTGTVRPDLPDEDLARLRQQIGGTKGRNHWMRTHKKYGIEK